jgi:UDP-4-amino-4,6-dideoxy-N-acetyl-beta-L-altrosamine N-acetyltransferase
MYSDHIISREEHASWMVGLAGDPWRRVFVVLTQDGETMGLVSVTAIDPIHKRADWAFYLAPEARGGLGAALEYHLLEYVFGELGLEKLNCEVLETNPAVVRMHGKFLFQEEGFRRSNVSKDGVRIGVHFLGLTREDWMAGRAAVRERILDVLDRFEIVLEPDS